MNRTYNPSRPNLTLPARSKGLRLQIRESCTKRTALENAQARLKDLYVWGRLSASDYKTQERATRLEVARPRPPRRPIYRSLPWKGWRDEPL